MPFPVAAGDLILAGDLNAVVPDGVTSWKTYTPALTAVTTNPTLGTGSLALGRYYRLGDLVTVHVKIVFGTSGVAAGTGSYRVSLPVNASVPTNWSFRPAGQVGLYDVSTGTNYAGRAYQDGTNATRIGMQTHGATGEVGAAVPFTWAASDEIWLWLAYEIA